MTIEGIQADGDEHWQEHRDAGDGGYDYRFGAVRRAKELSLGHAVLKCGKDEEANQEDLPELCDKERDGVQVPVDAEEAEGQKDVAEDLLYPCSPTELRQVRRFPCEERCGDERSGDIDQHEPEVDVQKHGRRAYFGGLTFELSRPRRQAA